MSLTNQSNTIIGNSLTAISTLSLGPTNRWMWTNFSETVLHLKDATNGTAIEIERGSLVGFLDSAHQFFNDGSGSVAFGGFSWNAAGTLTTPSITLNGVNRTTWPTSGSPDTNIFTPTSTIMFTNGTVLFDTTNQLIAGFLHISGSNVTDEAYYDLLIHVDFTPYADMVSICQFQGAQVGDGLIVLGQVDGNTGRAKLKVDVNNGTNDHIIRATFYGTNGPAITNVADNAISPTGEETLQTVNGKISASALEAASYVLRDANGARTRFINVNGAAIGDAGFGIGTNSVLMTIVSHGLVIQTNWVLEQRYTNNSTDGFSANAIQRARVKATIVCNGAVGGNGQCSLIVERANQSMTNTTTVSAQGVASLVNKEVLFDDLDPNDIFYFTDESTGGGSISILSGTGTWRGE